MAYHRLPARDIVYSIVDEECGRECGKVQTMFLKVSFTPLHIYIKRDRLIWLFCIPAPWKKEYWTKRLGYPSQTTNLHVARNVKTQEEFR